MLPLTISSRGHAPLNPPCFAMNRMLLRSHSFNLERGSAHPAMPRPKKSDTTRQSRQVSFRLTEADYAELAEFASKTGVSPGQLARRLVRSRRPKISIEVLQKTDPALLKRIERIGHNLNTISKNAFIFKRISPAIDRVCEEIRDILSEAFTQEIEE